MPVTYSGRYRWDCDRCGAWIEVEHDGPPREWASLTCSTQDMLDKLDVALCVECRAIVEGVIHGEGQGSVGGVSVAEAGNEVLQPRSESGGAGASGSGSYRGPTFKLR